MELRHLRYYVAVAEALSFRRAAAVLHVAQPALSKQLKDLENELGVRLLNRNTAGVSLTDAGAVMLEEARDILERVDMASASVREAQAGRGGRLAIATLGAVSASLLPRSLAVFRERYPRVEVELHEMSMPAQLAAIEAGTVQLGLGIVQGIVLPSYCTAVEVLVSQLMLAVGRKHRLAARSSISIADLAEESFLCIGTAGLNDMHAKLVEGILSARGLKHRRLKRVNGFESLFALVSSGHGVSLLLPFHLSRMKNAILFKPLREEGDDLALRLSAVWRNSGSSQLTQNFVDVFRQCIGESAASSRADRRPRA